MFPSLSTRVFCTPLIRFIMRLMRKRRSASGIIIGTLRRKECSGKKDDDLYVLSPLALCWNNDKYYLICYNQKYDNMNSYRVDRMEKVNKMERTMG